MSHLFFNKTDTLSALYYHSSNNISDHFCSTHEGAKIYYTYKDGKLIIAEDEDIEVCAKSYRYLYIVKQGDTKESIAKELGCSVKELFNEELPLQIPLVEGFLIIVDYRIENGEIIEISRIQ